MALFSGFFSVFLFQPLDGGYKKFACGLSRRCAAKLPDTSTFYCHIHFSLSTSTFNNAQCVCVCVCAGRGRGGWCAWGVFDKYFTRDTTLVLRIFLWPFGPLRCVCVCVATSKFISCFRGELGKFPIHRVPISPSPFSWVVQKGTENAWHWLICANLQFATTPRLAFWRIALAILQVFARVLGVVCRAGRVVAFC